MLLHNKDEMSKHVQKKVVCVATDRRGESQTLTSELDIEPGEVEFHSE